MQNLPNQSLFRGFSASDWNRPEQRFLTQLFKIFSFPSLSTFYSNAEKMRKIESFHAILPLLSLGKSILSIGLRILFPIIQKCSSFIIQVVS
jgi:hypothetical protein